MPSEVGDLYVTLRSVTAPFKRGMAEAAAEGEASTTRIGGAFRKLAGIGMVAGGIAAGIGVMSVKWAASFQEEMNKLQTQAGVAHSQMKTLSDGVLKLAGQVGFSPNSLAESLFHVESNFESLGISAPKALQMVKIAAEGAAVGHANLLDVTNALTAAVASGIPGVQNMSKAMGFLNATVGVGDMTMQNLAEAFGSGMLATVKGFGLSIQDVGAALATFGDNNIRGSLAGNQLRMSVMALAHPVSSAGNALKELGLKTDTLAKDMQKGGLKLALTDLISRMHKAGITSKQQGKIITEAFGRKAGAGLNVLVDQFGRLQSKYPKLAEGAHKFGSSWAKTQQNFNQKLHETEQGFVSLGIKLGTALMPYVTKFLGWIHKGVTWLTQHKGAVVALAGALGTTLVAAIIAVGTALYTALGPEMLIAAGIMAVGAAIVYAYKHFKTFHRIVDEVGKFLGTVFKTAWKLAGDAIHWFTKNVLPLVKKGFTELVSWFQSHKKTFVEAWNTLVHDVRKAVDWFNKNVIVWVKARMAELTAWWKQHGQQIKTIASNVFKFLELVAKVWWDTVLHPLLKVVEGVWKATWSTIKNTVKVIWAAISGVIKTAMHVVMNTIGLILDVITGKWSKVWGDLKKLVGQGLNDAISTIKNVTSSFGTLLWDAGKSLIHGLISGIKSAMGGLGSALGSIGSFITSHKGPPEYDKVMLVPAGRMIMQGLVDGLNSRLGHLASTAAGVGQTLQTAFAEELGIASPSRKFKALGAWVMHGLISGLTGSTARVRSATERIARALYVDFGSHHKGLQRAVARDNSELMSLARHRDSVATRLKAAQKRLAALQKEWTSERNSVAQGIMQSASIITTAPQEGFALTAQDVVNNMRDQVGKAMQFAAELQTLRKKGLSSDLVAQIAAAGVDQGGATAAALAGASAGTLKQLNQLQGSMKSAANSTGAAVADSMYGSGIKAAQGLVKGLQSQEKAIEKQMMRIAESMQKAIKHALGIHSPSRVFAEIGTWVPKGLAKGVDEGAHHATAAVHRLAGSVAGAGGRGGAGLALAGTGGGTVINHYHFEFEVKGSVATVDRLAKDVETAFLRRGMRNPLTYPAYKR